MGAPSHDWIARVMRPRTPPALVLDRGDLYPVLLDQARDDVAERPRVRAASEAVELGVADPAAMRPHCRITSWQSASCWLSFMRSSASVRV